IPAISFCFTVGISLDSMACLMRSCDMMTLRSPRMHISVSLSSSAALRPSLRGAGSHQTGGASPISPKTNSRRRHRQGNNRRHPARPPPNQSKNPSAIWLWGRLLDFESNGPLDTDPEDLMETMTDVMRVAGYPCQQYDSERQRDQQPPRYSAR